MKAHNAWTIEFKRDIPSRVPFNFISCTESSKCIWRVLYRNKKKHFHSLYREETSNQKLDRLGANNSRNIVRILQPKFSRKEERECKRLLGHRGCAPPDLPMLNSRVVKMAFETC